jgi:hypothetical protein
MVARVPHSGRYKECPVYYPVGVFVYPTRVSATDTCSRSLRQNRSAVRWRCPRLRRHAAHPAGLHIWECPLNRAWPSGHHPAAPGLRTN